MRVVLFVGPSLHGLEFAGRDAFLVRAPAAQGDVLEEVRHGAEVIGLIDGQFEVVPAVWHKEILWALAQGVHVFGAASMGALRAAELCSFGMVGIGRIFEDYVSGRLEDDDEVAVLHGPAELGYPPLSESMVDIRGALTAAVEEGAISERTACRLNERAKSLFFKERSWANLLPSLPKGERKRFEAWITKHKPSCKGADALKLVREVLRFTQQGPPPHRPTFQFQHTKNWERLLQARRSAVPINERKRRRS